MNITYLSASSIPSRSANSVHVMKMCQAFCANGHTVTLIAMSGDPSVGGGGDEFAFYGVTPGFTIKKLPSAKIRWLGNALFLGAIWQTIRKRPFPGLLFSRNLLGLAVVAHLGIPMILELHDIVEHSLVKRITRYILRQPHLLGFVVISEALAEEYRRVFPELVDVQIVVAHDGADVPAVDDKACDTVPIPKESDVLLAGYAGHLYPGRGIEVILAVASRMPQVQFHLVGGTQDDLEEWRKQCESDNVTFHGYVPHGLVTGYLHRFDVLLAPYQKKVSVSGGGGNTVRWMSPLKIFEYMSACKAILASDLPVLREVLSDRENALLVDPDDVEQWVGALSTLARSPELRRQLGERAYQDFVEKYTWQGRAKAVLAFASS